MIRSQIPLSLPPVPPAHTKKKIWKRARRGGRPAVVNGPAVRVHLGGGGVREWITGSLRLQEPALPPHPLFSPETGERNWMLDRICGAAAAKIS